MKHSILEKIIEDPLFYKFTMTDDEEYADWEYALEDWRAYLIKKSFSTKKVLESETTKQLNNLLHSILDLSVFPFVEDDIKHNKNIFHNDFLFGDTIGEGRVPNLNNIKAKTFDKKIHSSDVPSENKCDLKEVSGIMASVLFWDRTKKGVGLGALIGQKIKYRKEEERVVITNHRGPDELDLAMRNLNRMVAAEIKLGNYNKKTGIGYVVCLNTLLNNESTLGNPTTFHRVIDKYGSKISFEKALNSGSKVKREELRLHMRIAAGLNYSTLDQALFMGIMGNITLTKEMVAQIKKILKSELNEIDSSSFTRSRLFKMRIFIAKSMLSKAQKREIYAAENDLDWDFIPTDTEGNSDGEIISFTTIPFKVDPTSYEEFTGFTAFEDRDVDYLGCIIDDGTIDEKPQLKIVDELYSISELFPKMSLEKEDIVEKYNQINRLFKCIMTFGSNDLISSFHSEYLGNNEAKIKLQEKIYPGDIHGN